MKKTIEQTLTIPNTLHGQRLDIALAELMADYSRARLKTWIEAGYITRNQQTCQPKTKVQTDDLIHITVTLSEQTSCQPEPITLQIAYEDDAILIINKPAGLVVHPAAGNPDGTLVNALLYHCPALQSLPRAGIVHRLDKDTTGLMVVAKTLQAHHHLVKHLQARDMKRTYQAVIYGQLTGGGTISAPIGRHPRNRLKMAVVNSGKPATTHYTILQRFLDFTHIEVNLESGRTHQIRVHMAYKHHPIVGDPLYTRLHFPKHASTNLKTLLTRCRRQALHASRLVLTHPVTQAELNFTAPLPKDLDTLLQGLKNENAYT